MHEVKSYLHQLIEENQNLELLETLTEILEQNKTEGAIWNTLSYNEKQRVLLAEKKTIYPDKQTSHEEMIRMNKKW